MEVTTTGEGISGAVRMSAGIRALYWFVFWSMPVAVDLTAVSTREPAAAIAIVIAGAAWLVLLRGMHKRITYSAREIAFRGSLSIRSIAAADVVGGWLEAGGGVLMVLLRDNTYARFDVGDWALGPSIDEQRAAVLRAIREEIDAPYGRRIALDRTEKSLKEGPAGRRALHARVAPLLPSEWAAIVASIALVSFQLVRGA